ncbi:Predicted phospholipase, patatin/cPLA2 family [Amycolatopsis sacchari]|uniref:Predicted phospholipase, patatin/cPLA2 family n=1 Tax=Amycolatopsis sacchari TaxID=115433 RepID=A0A1I3K9E2_9PSEU|nr:patatin-like phospholipase family protein [Amycolatopsis sacchari]SFI69116.1 Predicted phospholipase, patatin/cPLA2 family [Amycolatopsis sacchari]
MGVSVLDVVRARAAEGSVPGARRDPYRLGLAIEGGGSRGTYSSGMAVELERRGLTSVFDDVYGSSMGAITGAWLLSGKAEHGASFWWHPDVLPNVIRPRAALRRKPVVDLEFLMNEVYQRWAGLDFDGVLANPVRLHPIGTDADTGAAVDLAPHLRDAETLKLALRGSAGLPLLAGPLVRLGGRRLLDGGLTEPIPFHSALRDGCTHVLVLRTRRADERPQQPPRVENLAVTAFLRRTAPATLPAWRGRPERRRTDDEQLAGSEALTQVLVPPGAPDVSRLAVDPALLRRAFDLGASAMATAFEAGR